MEHKEYLSMIGKKGGKQRAKKYSKEILSAWSKKGGRPRKNGVKKDE